MKVTDFVVSFDFGYSIIDFLIVVIGLFVVANCCFIDCFTIADFEYFIVDYFDLKN